MLCILLREGHHLLFIILGHIYQFSYFLYFLMPMSLLYVMILNIIGCEISIQPSIHSIDVIVKGLGFSKSCHISRLLLTYSIDKRMRKLSNSIFQCLLGVQYLPGASFELLILLMAFFSTLCLSIS